MSNVGELRNYSDYRAFLLSHAQKEKVRLKKWTYGVWSQKLGLQSTSSITKIIQGERHPGEKITQKLIEYFGFKERDAQYFRDLVRLQKVKNDPRLSALILENIGKTTKNSSTQMMNELQTLKVCEWYVMAIREMIRMDEFFEDASWISKSFSFKVTQVEARKAIENMLAIGLLDRDEENRLVVCSDRVLTTNNVSSEAIRRYHEQMLDNAKLALRKFSVDERMFMGSTICVRSENLPQAKELINEYRKKLVEIIEEPSGNQIYQFQMQFFPLTKKINKQEI